MSEEMRSCVTCVHLHNKCNGECDGCENSIVHTSDKDSLSLRDILSPRITSRCKCLECDESNGFKYYVEDTEKTRFLK